MSMKKHREQWRALRDEAGKVFAALFCVTRERYTDPYQQYGLGNPYLVDLL